MTPLLPPHVGADELDDPFWDGCRRHEFLLHVCRECSRAYWPAASCIDHGWAPMEWRPSSGRGEVFTYTVFHHAYMPWLADRVPYAIAVVRLDEGPFFHTDIVGCAPSEVAIGLRVEAVFEEAGEGWVLPHFRPISTDCRNCRHFGGWRRRLSKGGAGPPASVGGRDGLPTGRAVP